MCNRLVSIVVPVYNVEEYLDACLTSISLQSYSNIEVIVVDDGATDSSPDICDRWAELDSRFQVVHQSNKGLSSARNEGIKRSRGDYLLFVDSDDLIDEKLVEIAVNACEREKADICFYRFANFENKITELTPYAESNLFPKVASSNSKSALMHLFGQRIHNYAWMHIASMSLYRSTGFEFPVGRNMEDMATTSGLLAASSRVAYIPDVLYFYRKRSQSIVSSWSYDLSLDTIRALDLSGKTIGLADLDVRKAYLNYRIKMLCYCWMNELKEDKSGLSLQRRKRMISDEVRQTVSLSSWSSIGWANRIKCVLLYSGLLDIAKRAKCLLDRK